MRVKLPIALIGLLLMLRTAGAADHPAILVELFTSEGCDSCPPADAVLMRLAQQRNIAGAEVIVMSEHVDYWNHLGWTDPYSSRQFTQRQNEYADALGANVYTPQIIVDGRHDVLGSNYAAVVDTVSRASRNAKAPLTVEAKWREKTLDLHVAASPVREAAHVYVAITEDKLSNNVSRGENKGRRLTHTGVVRRLSLLGAPKSNTPFAVDQAIPLSPEWKIADLHAVVFTQGRKSHAVLAVVDIPSQRN
jgi:hypothetical protein